MSRFPKKTIIVIIVILLFLFIASPIRVIPAGHVGVKDFFGYVSDNIMQPGIGFVVPFTRVVKMSIRTQEFLETANTPSKEGLMIDLNVSLLYRIDPRKAVEIYKTVGSNYKEVVVQPQLRSAVREVTASYEAKALYSAEREKIANEIKSLYQRMTTQRGIITDQVLLRNIGLPQTLAGAIQEKLKREQESEQMTFILQKEKKEAERKRIEAQGIADFQKIVAQGISQELLQWKGIEATSHLASSQNAKIVIIGNSKNGLPIILGAEK